MTTNAQVNARVIEGEGVSCAYVHGTLGVIRAVPIHELGVVIDTRRGVLRYRALLDIVRLF